MTVAPFAGPVRGLCNHYAQFGVLCAMEMAAGSCIWWAHSEDYATLQKPNGRILRWVSMHVGFAMTHRATRSFIICITFTDHIINVFPAGRIGNWLLKAISLRYGESLLVNELPSLVDLCFATNEALSILTALEKPRRLLALIILIVAGCYLSGVAIYTFCIARARHRQHMVETKVDKLTDSWLVKMALSLYLLVAPPALLLSAWLGFGVHLGPKVGLKMFNLSFEQSRTGKSVQLRLLPSLCSLMSPAGVRLFMASASIIFISLLWRLISLYYDIRHQSPKTAVELSDEY